jgi:hypothetical protein
LQIDIDFEVFKGLTAKLQNEADSYNEVIRRLLGLPSTDLAASLGELSEKGEAWSTELPSGTLSGVWYGNVFFPDGTTFRATYKGRTHFAQVRSGRWVDQDGFERTSPSDAASAISTSNVNGWKFWYGKRPTDLDWLRLDEFRL